MLERYATALERACRRQPPARLRLRRVGLARTCVLLGAEPVDDACARLHGRYAHELGADDWFQRGVVRDLWYVSLVHFGRALTEGSALLDWAGGRRQVDLGTATCDRVQIICWTLAAGRVDGAVLAESRLGG